MNSVVCAVGLPLATSASLPGSSSTSSTERRITSSRALAAAWRAREAARQRSTIFLPSGIFLRKRASSALVDDGMHLPLHLVGAQLRLGLAR